MVNLIWFSRYFSDYKALHDTSAKCSLKFFFDVHPPLGKILLALIGYLNNYQGDFECKMVGEAYRIDFPYVELRMFCGILSSFLPVFCFCIVWIGTTSFKASLMAGAFVLFDNSMILIGRLILLDSMLLFFMVSSLLCFAKSQRYEPTSRYQVIWLILTGVCLGFEISTKLVGLFTMSFYILRCICTFWQQLLPNKSHSLLTLSRFCGVHILCLAVIPFTIYFLIFMIHFELLKYSGTGDYLFSAPFQSHLHGNMFNDLSLPKYVSYGSEIVLKNVGGKAYLNHPMQSDCHKLNNLVTTYPIINDEAFWKFRPFLDIEENGVKYVSDGDVVQLKHSSSMKLLKRLPSSTIHASQDVVCTNETNEVDENHFYRIQTDLAESPGVSVSDGNTGSKDDLEWNNEDGKMLLKPMEHVFKLVGVDDDCFLQSTEWPIILPGHKEVSCTLTKFNEKNLWYVEWLRDEKAEKVHVDIQPMTIWQRFIETHIIMLKANSDLKAGKDDTISSPWQWLFNIPGQPILGPYYIIYLLGTPITWFMSTAILLAFVISKAVIMMTQHRASSAASSTVSPSMETCLWMIISWFLHYFPFFLMTRPLYFHHYLPAAIFKFMGAGLVHSH